MKYLIFYGIFGIALAVPAILAFVWITRDKSGTGQVANNNLKAIGTGADAVRVLDQILTDPTLIASSEWEYNARAVVREWYGTPPRPRKRGQIR